MRARPHLQQPRCLTALLLCAFAILAGCGEAPTTGPDDGTPAGRDDGLPPTARPETVAELRAGLAAPRHESDGGGRAWLEPDRARDEGLQAGSSARFEFGFEVGPEGIGVGGALYFQVSPFWGWSSPQARAPRSLGYTTVETAAEGVELRARALGPQLLFIEVQGRPLASGERLRLVYGAGPGGALVDRHAERRSTFWFAVDGDGDGVRELIADPPSVAILPGPPARLAALLPGSARPGEPTRLTIAVLDPLAAAWVEVAGTVRLSSEPPGLSMPTTIELEPDERGVRTLEVLAPNEGTWRVRAELERADGTAPLVATSNPMWVEADGEPVFWADLHGHSELSDGTGTPEEYFRYAREVAALDAVALTDHDHWGMRFLDATPAMWDEVADQVRAFHAPGRFVTILGYEWTNWIYGHRHVLYFADEGHVHSSIDPAHETPKQLWDALRGSPAMTFAHHSAGGPVAVDWSYAPDPELEPLTEIVSVHGSSEAMDSPGRIYSPLRGNFVRDVLDRGHRLGFVGSGDGHDGHPGLAHLSPIYGYTARDPVGGGRRVGKGGLAAVRAPELSRAALLEAFRARRTWATSGPRILLDVELNGFVAGSAVPATALRGDALVQMRVSGTAPLETLDVIRSGVLVERAVCSGRTDLEQLTKLSRLAPGEYVYVRVAQADGGLAWSSPFFVE